MKSVVIYARVSSNGDRQDYQRQINDLTEVAKSQTLHVEKIFAEKISGGKRNNERKALVQILEASGHPFRKHPDTRSGNIRTPVPGLSGQ